MGIESSKKCGTFSDMKAIFYHLREINIEQIPMNADECVIGIKSNFKKQNNRQ